MTDLIQQIKAIELLRSMTKIPDQQLLKHFI